MDLQLNGKRALVTGSSGGIGEEIAKDKGWDKDWRAIEKRVVEEVLPNPVGRLGRVEDVANLVAFLASPLSGYINGANLRVDGGYVKGVN